jgi:hypothetical protein
VDFSTLWVGEHVVLFDRHDSKYPIPTPASSRPGRPRLARSVH